MDKIYAKQFQELLSEKGTYRNLDEVRFELFTVVGRILDDKGPQFTVDIVHKLYLGSERKLNDIRRDSVYSRISFYLSQSVKTFASLTKTEYGISGITFQEAIKKTHGAVDDILYGFDRTKTIEQVFQVKSNSVLLYKTDESLQEFIEKYTEKTTKIIVVAKIRRY